MELDQLPVELIYFILEKLAWNDLLRLRRVSTRLKFIVDSYIRENGGIPNNVEIVIRSTGFGTFGDFLDLGFSATRFYLCNDYQIQFFDDDLFDSDDITAFLETYGDQITNLRVCRMYTNPSKLQLNFYENLTNLHSLEIESMGKHDKYPSLSKLLAKRFNVFQWFKGHDVVFPKTFENLKILSVSQGKCESMYLSTFRLNLYNTAIFNNCNNLIYFKLAVPIYNSDRGDEDSYNNSQASYLAGSFRLLRTHVIQRDLNADLTPGFYNLKFVDLENLGTNLSGKVLKKVSHSFLLACSTFHRFNILLQNVPVKIFSAYNAFIHNSDSISRIVRSMTGLHRVVLGLELPILEDLSITTMTNVSFRGAQHPYQVQWPALKHLQVSVMGTKVECFTKPASISAQDLFAVLFGNNVERYALRMLSLRFPSRMRDTFSSNLSLFPFPQVEDITNSCLNITALRICGWPDGDNINFSKLWKGLILLKNVHLLKCKLLGDEGFIGEDENRPAFLELKHLETLKLTALNVMPLITDKLFSTVLKHISLNSLLLQSDKPLTNITKNGIASLLSGPFATSIQQFPFDNWSLANTDDLEFAVLKNRFRSSSRM